MNGLLTSPSLITWSTNWVFHSHLQNTSGHLTSSPKYSLRFCNQLEYTHGNMGSFKFLLLLKIFCKILYLSFHLSKDLWSYFLHIIFLLNHSFQIFLPDLLHLNSFIPLWKLHSCVSSGSGPSETSEPMFSSIFLREELEKVEGVPLDGMIPPSS